jgi:hypothetical protein
MKRSEMLKIIEGLFNLAPRFDNETNAENLLSTLEEIGMRPPYNASEDDGVDSFEWESEEEFPRSGAV